MKEQLISFETAKLASKKGFYWWTEKRYNRNGLFNESKSWSISAPTQSLLQKWLREEHGFSFEIQTKYNKPSQISSDFWRLSIKDMNRLFKNCNPNRAYITGKTYEEVLEKGLQEALKLINN